MCIRAHARSVRFLLGAGILHDNVMAMKFLPVREGSLPRFSPCFPHPPLTFLLNVNLSTYNQFLFSTPFRTLYLTTPFYTIFTFPNKHMHKYSFMCTYLHMSNLLPFRRFSHRCRKSSRQCDMAIMNFWLCLLV